MRPHPAAGADLAAYREALLGRFSNPNIRHALAQIAADGSLKVGVRIVPTLRAELAQGRVAEGAARVVAAWVQHLRGLGAPVKDARAAEVQQLAVGTLEETVAGVLHFLDPDLAGDERLRAAVVSQATQLADLAREDTER